MSIGRFRALSHRTGHFFSVGVKVARYAYSGRTFLPFKTGHFFRGFQYVFLCLSVLGYIDGSMAFTSTIAMSATIQAAAMGIRAIVFQWGSFYLCGVRGFLFLRCFRNHLLPIRPVTFRCSTSNFREPPLLYDVHVARGGPFILVPNFALPLFFGVFTTILSAT